MGGVDKAVHGGLAGRFLSAKLKANHCELRSELGQHCFRHMDIHATRCLNTRRGSIMEADHEKAEYPWDRLWSDLVDCCASLGSVVARKERGGIR